MSAYFDQQRVATLRSICDTIVPSIDRDHDPHALWATSASDLGVPEAAEQFLLGLPADQRDGMLMLLDALAQQNITGLSQASREQTLRNVSLFGGTPAAAGVGALTSLVLFLVYGGADPATGRNPMWASLGYPGPLSAPPAEPKTITPVEPTGDCLELSADVVVVGSGAGGGVIAGVLAGRGLDVVVLEAGGYRNEADFTMLELPAYQEMYWRGGPQTSADGNITVLSGATLGGGTTINWMNCLRTRPWVREEWAAAGLADVASAEFDKHLDAVSQRINVTDACTDLNKVHQKMEAGAKVLGWNASMASRNADPSRYDPASGGFVGFGDQSGAKNSTLRTYLQDAYDAGARIVVRTFVERVLLERGRAAGVVGTWHDPASGRRASVTVRAPQVVVAASSLESPALLLRSGIGGPAVGQHLRLHPTIATLGRYGDDLEAWWGPPHALLVDEFESGADAEGFGFRIEGAQYAPGVIGSGISWTSAEQHKAMMEQYRYYGAFLGRIRDHGAGRVTIDANGQAQVSYSLDDPVDVRTMHRALESLAQLHRAAGASEIVLLGQGTPTWRRGDALDDFVAQLQRVPLRFGGVKLFTAHEMGSCRMGSDPATSVADPDGQLHDTPGVWIGDASAFPTASGTNPMLSVMALAHRTADALAATY